MINIVVVMAGSGHRFKVAGYEKHKPLIDVNGLPMIQRVIDNLRPKTRDYRFIFVCLKNMVTPELMEIFQKEDNAYVIQLPYITQGAAITASVTSSICGCGEPMIVAACDQLIDVPIDDFIDYSWNHDGCIATFKNDNLSHSFCVIKKDKVVEVIEKPKKKVSDDANIGIYWFKRSHNFIKAVGDMIKDGFRVNGEYYVAPTYNYLIKAGLDVVNYNIPKEKTHLIGTPIEMEEYVNKSR